MKVLFVTTTFPLPPHAGAKVALLETLRSIEDLCELHLLVPSPDADGAKLAAALQQMLPRTNVHFYQARAQQPARLEKYTVAALTAFSGRSYHAAIWMDKNLRQRAAELAGAHRFDVVHCEWLYPAIALKGLPLPMVVRTLDLHSTLMRDGLAELPDSKRLRKSLWRLEAERFRRFEIGVLNDALVTISVSREDEEVLRREGVKRIVMIPPPMALPPPAPPRADADVCHALFLCML
ncbi:MAG TPA: glycosyltransferase, partial [Pyrinomonadaceae bacterium]|nr:glycosyltransferase [Pyrinomonadaceae bacterium]